MCPRISWNIIARQPEQEKRREELAKAQTDLEKLPKDAISLLSRLEDFYNGDYGDASEKAPDLIFEYRHKMKEIPTEQICPLIKPLPEIAPDDICKLLLERSSKGDAIAEKEISRMFDRIVREGKKGRMDEVSRKLIRTFADLGGEACQKERRLKDAPTARRTGVFLLTGAMPPKKRDAAKKRSARTASATTAKTAAKPSAVLKVRTK